MALINCFECGKEVSDKALSCPHCGIPFNKISVVTEINTLQEINIPNLPADLKIGKHVWDSVFFDGYFDGRENVNSKISSGKVKVFLHTHGIKIMYGSNFYPIHNAQIISLKKTTQEELTKVDKSVIGRAVVGALILGPLGAIVGGISGIGSKEKFLNKQYFIINFWDIETKSVQTILISSKENTKIDDFILRQQKEANQNISENRTPEDESNALGIGCIVIIILCVILMFWKVISNIYF